MWFIVKGEKMIYVFSSDCNRTRGENTTMTDSLFQITQTHNAALRLKAKSPAHTSMLTR